MDYLKIRNENGLELTVTTNHPEDSMPIMGGDPARPTWEEYISNYKDEYKPYIELIKKAIIELGWIGQTGGDRANDTCFVFSDGKSLGFSWRGWGDLMQAIVGKREGYMAYYM